MSRKLSPEEKAQSAARHKEKQRAWRIANKAHANEKMRAWRKANPEKTAVSKRRANLKLWYGVTPEWFDATLVAQGGCAICAVTDAAKRGGWNVDHDHATGKVRGVLCGHCNRAIGSLKDDPDVCVSAAKYLIRHKGTVNVS